MAYFLATLYIVKLFWLVWVYVFNIKNAQTSAF